MERVLPGYNVNNRTAPLITADEPSNGGASHRYLASWIDANGNKGSSWIYFQKGPIKEVGVNGLTEKALLEIVKDRWLAFQTGDYACPENEAAIQALDHVLWIMEQRTRNREARGVEGTSAV